MYDTLLYIHEMMHCDFLQAEKESERRKESVRKVCRNLQLKYVFDSSAVGNKQLISEQQYNLFHHLLVNEEHKVIYCYIPKVGCSNIKRILLVMQGTYESIDTAIPHTSNDSELRLTNEKFSNEQRQYMLKHFYKFMIVRDPLERLVSAYRNKLQKKYNEFFVTLGKKLVEKYRYNSKRRAGPEDNATFTECVRYLVDNPSWKINEHWMPYEELCRPCNVEYNFIGSIDNLNRDINYVLSRIQANESKYYLSSRGKVLIKTKQRTASFLKELPMKYFDQLLTKYKNDHELFDYPLPDYQTLEKRYPV